MIVHNSLQSGAARVEVSKTSIRAYANRPKRARDLRVCVVAVRPKTQICSTVRNLTSHMGNISFLKFGLVFGNCDLDLYPHGRIGASNYC
jgi:hypothetical protein